MLFVSHIKPPDKQGKSYRVVIVAPGHGKVRLGGYPGLSATRRLQARLDVLVGAKAQGDPVPQYLADWVRSMPDRRADTLIRVGLIDPRHRRAVLPIAEHIDTYEKVVAARRDNRTSHARATASCLNRVKRALNLQVYDDLNETDLLGWLGEQGYTPANERHYLQAWGGFCQWMVR